jgi:hypothetical protein
MNCEGTEEQILWIVEVFCYETSYILGWVILRHLQLVQLEVVPAFEKYCI